MLDYFFFQAKFSAMAVAWLSCEHALNHRMPMGTPLATATVNATASNRRLWGARWQQTYQVNFHWWRSSEHAHITENNGFYLLSLLPPSAPKVPHWIRPMILIITMLYIHDGGIEPPNQCDMMRIATAAVPDLKSASSWHIQVLRPLQKNKP